MLVEVLAYNHTFIGNEVWQVDIGKNPGVHFEELSSGRPIPIGPGACVYGSNSEKFAVLSQKISPMVVPRILRLTRG